MARIAAMLRAGTIRRVRQTLLASNLAEGALVAWKVPEEKVDAAALVKRQPPSMDLALSAMYDWLIRHPRIARDDLVVDTGSGLSYHTRITAHELVAILRNLAARAEAA